MNRKEQLTQEGLQQIVNLRASINNGLSPKLKEAFPDTIPVQRPIVKDLRRPVAQGATGQEDSERYLRPIHHLFHTR